MAESESQKKKTIYFLMSIGGIGGTGKSFVELLKTLPYDRYEVHIGFMEQRGVLMQHIPQDVHIHTLPPLSNVEALVSMIKTFRWVNAILFLISIAYGRLTHDDYWFCRIKYHNTPHLDGHYDLAIAFRSVPSEFVWYLCHRVQAKKKCIWVHEDVSIPTERIKYKMVERMSHCLDRVFVVSEEAKAHFDTVFPQMKHKTVTFSNIISTETIMELAKSGKTFRDSYQGHRILSVGRIHEAKGLLMAVHALRILLNKGLDIRWYIIGGKIGNKYYQQCRRLSQKENVADHFIFLGEQAYPYRFMKDCDVYVQPSNYESFCITISEAMCFDNPIVATSFCGAHEQIEGRPNGFITEMSAEALANGIEKALSVGKIRQDLPQKEPDFRKFDSLLQ